MSRVFFINCSLTFFTIISTIFACYSVYFGCNLIALPSPKRSFSVISRCNRGILSFSQMWTLNSPSYFKFRIYVVICFHISFRSFLFMHLEKASFKNCSKDIFWLISFYSFGYEHTNSFKRDTFISETLN